MLVAWALWCPDRSYMKHVRFPRPAIALLLGQICCSCMACVAHLWEQGQGAHSLESSGIKELQRAYLGVLIDLGLVLDVLGSGCIAQRAQRLFQIVVGRADCGNHDCLGVAPQGTLQQARELALSIRDMPCMMRAKLAGSDEGCLRSTQRLPAIFICFLGTLN